MQLRFLLLRFFVAGLLLIAAQANAVTRPNIILPEVGLRAEQLGIVINENDPLSLQIGKYYQRQRNIPGKNVVYVDFDPARSVVEPGRFAVMQRKLERTLPESVQALALTWAAPYRVGCMSISSAFSFGFNHRYCAKGCKRTAPSPYAGYKGSEPYTDLGIRPTMLIAATNFEDAKALIDRGVASDGLAVVNEMVKPQAYLVATSDTNRSVRERFFPSIDQRLGDHIAVNIRKTEAIKNESDVMFYFTGDESIAGIDSNEYLPGAIADHLTSAGGKLTDSSQMSAIEWLRGGATGSYGTVVEPCNFVEKFPHPGSAMQAYLSGATLIEAYWQSVLMPGQGVFIGEPLAAPYRGYRLKIRAEGLELVSPQLAPGFYRLLAADSAEGAFYLLRSGLKIDQYQRSILIEPPYRKWYKIEKLLDVVSPAAM